MKLAKLALLTLASLVLFIGCDDDPGEGQLRVNFEMTKDGTPINLNEDYTGDQITAMRVEKLKYYLSDIKLLGANDALKSVEVVDFETGRTSFTFNAVQEGTYSGFSYRLGLSPEQNGSDPLDFETGHPLSASWGLYWSWATKYRFILMEGRGAEDGTLDGQGDDFIISMHPGADEFAQAVSFSKNIEIVEGETRTLTIQIDVDDMFDGPGGLVDLPAENQTHTTPGDRDIALKFIQNFAAAMSLK